MKFLSIALLLGFTQPIAFAQSAKKMFAGSEPLIKQYRIDCQKAWDKNDSKLAETYYDSIKMAIVNSYVGNHRFKTLNGKPLILGKMNKPVLLTVSASWCAPCRAEVPALNKIAANYKDKIDMIVLFWDTKEATAKLAKNYDSSIAIVPSIVQQKGDVHIVDIAGFRHITGFPTTYMIATNQKIVRMAEGAGVPGTYPVGNGKMVTITDDQALDSNYKRLKEDVDFLLSNNGK